MKFSPLSIILAGLAVGAIADEDNRDPYAACGMIDCHLMSFPGNTASAEEVALFEACCI